MDQYQPLAKSIFVKQKGVKSIKALLVDKKGSTVFLLSMYILVPMMVLSLFAIDSRFLQVKRDMIDDAIVSAGLAALANPFEDELAYGNYNLDKTQAKAVFEEHLAGSLKLHQVSNKLIPMDNSIAVGEVIIEEFIIYNQDEISSGLICPEGTPIQSTTIHIVLNITVSRSSLIGLFGDEVTIRIHRDVDNYYALDMF